MGAKYDLFFLTLFLVMTCTFGYFGNVLDDDCFCQLHGKIDDCSCNVDTVDHFNNVKIYPRLRSLLHKGYFRFYKVNLRRPCPFWSDDSRCSMRYCHVEACEDKDIPVGLKGGLENHSSKNLYVTQSCEDDHNAELGYLNTTISAKVQEDIVLWSAYDDAQDNFCVLEDNDSESEYVDLLLNPERFTGYKGKSAHRIWNSIYMENCFTSTRNDNPYIQSSKLNNMCLEERVFYRVISGLHASINIHLCAQYLLSETSLSERDGKWGPNLSEFLTRFSKETTQGEGPHWLRNLYFVYLLELRALNKASRYLEKEEFYTGNENEDWDTQLAVKDLLNVVQKFPDHFNETTMFSGSEQAEKLKYEFKQHFRNVSKIMDCVGCDKCRLWGKLQVQGLGTALKILFSGKFDDQPDLSMDKKKFQLQRTEIVSLINSIGRLSTSIYELDEFRQMLR
ncbi:ero1-like protein isoform X1 [Tribolium madens]|uniref:ero1-like protein isoform X1 n=1 Tax=Tribolium madens TaxID=41895 RepID=UPI001CF761C3|nr:ero1-like protein isoform X1 [Tribolium madens]